MHRRRSDAEARHHACCQREHFISAATVLLGERGARAEAEGEVRLQNEKGPSKFRRGAVGGGGGAPQEAPGAQGGRERAPRRWRVQHCSYSHAKHTGRPAAATFLRQSQNALSRAHSLATLESVRAHTLAPLESRLRRLSRDARVHLCARVPGVWSPRSPWPPTPIPPQTRTHMTRRHDHTHATAQAAAP